MPTFKIATWNVNSIRVRLPDVLEWLTLMQPDVLALQEIKMPTEDFPKEAFQKIGYAATVNGQRTYNGVAILSRCEMTENCEELPHFSDIQRRLLAVTISGIRVINIY